ncbi:hypothetical protein TNCV_1170791 [Trichonephila clavipes]|nr:hypothetical protein TNCV_1170791 [Trichonephila clavipes]
MHVKSVESSNVPVGVVVRRGRCQLRCRPRYLIMVQNYVVVAKSPRVTEQCDVDIQSINWRGVEVWRMGCQLRYRSLFLAVARNDETRCQGPLRCFSEGVNINVALLSYSRTFGNGPRNFEPWLRDEVNT